MKLLKILVCFVIGFLLAVVIMQSSHGYSIDRDRSYEIAQQIKAKVAYSAYQERSDYGQLYDQGMGDFNKLEALGIKYANACYNLTGSYGEYICRVAQRNRLGF